MRNDIIGSGGDANKIKEEEVKKGVSFRRDKKKIKRKTRARAGPDADKQSANDPRLSNGQSFQNKPNRNNKKIILRI